MKQLAMIAGLLAGMGAAQGQDSPVFLDRGALDWRDNLAADPVLNWRFYQAAEPANNAGLILDAGTLMDKGAAGGYWSPDWRGGSWEIPQPDPAPDIPTLLENYDFSALQHWNPMAGDGLVLSQPDVWTEMSRFPGLDELLAGNADLLTLNDFATRFEPENPWDTLTFAQLLEANPASYRDPAAPLWQSTVTALESAYDQGDLSAGALWAEHVLAGRGLGGLDIAAVEGRAVTALLEGVEDGTPAAFTILAEQFVRDPSLPNADEALAMAQTGWALGDANAGLVLARLGVDVFQPEQGIDLMVATYTSGTADRREAAGMEINRACSDAAMICVPLRVGVVTSRAVPDPGNPSPWTDRAAADGALNYGFVTAQVPFVRRDAMWVPPAWQEEAEGGNVLGGVPLDQDRRALYTLGGFADRPDFLAALVAAAPEEAGKYLLYVHGFNNSVEDALLSLTRLKQRGQLPGVPVIYSWPAGKEQARYDSSKSPLPYLGYGHDIQLASNECPVFRQFLLDFTGAVGAQNVILIAHSHGAKLVHSALTDCEFMGEPPPRLAEKLHSLIYLAPDIDLEQFSASFAQLEGQASRTTIYVSTRDLAIQTSGNVMRGGLLRLAQTAEFFADWLETVDASDITEPGFEFGHSYGMVHRAALNDIRLTIEGEKPPRRCHIKPPVNSVYRLDSGLCP